MNKQHAVNAIRCLVMLWVLALMPGCDDAEKGNALSIDPASSDVSGRGATLLLTAMVAVEDEEVILPLAWSVQNPSLGGILSSAGMTAVYRSSGAIGQNVVFCKDRFGREGLAVINQGAGE